MDTKKLRQKILDLAIRGKLVPQDPKDEPVSVLLERIRAEKERLIKEGKIKRSKKVAADDEIEAPFEIPESWEWVRLCDITELIEDCPHSTAKDEGHGYPLIRTPNVGEGYLILDGVHRVSESVYNKRNARAVPETNDIIYAREAPAGNAAVIKDNEIVCLGQRTVLIRPFKNFINSKLLAYFIISPHSRNSLISTAVGSTATHVNLENIRPFNIPIPPLAEQKRIANEVERWFALIDSLESNEGDLLKAIDKAKSKILDLAIHGKLVPQDPNDEPAIELLKRINPKFEPCDNEFETNKLPDSWCWARLESISTDSADGPFGSNLKKEHYTSNKEVRIIQLSNIGEEGWREENTKYTTFDHLRDISRSEVMPNDVVIAKMMPAGRAILCPNNEKKYVLSSDAVKFHIIDNIDCRFILYAINSDTFRKQVYEDVQGVTRVRTSLQKLRKYCLPIPPYKEQHRIVEKIEELFAVLDGIKESLE